MRATNSKLGSEKFKVIIEVDNSNYLLFDDIPDMDIKSHDGNLKRTERFDGVDGPEEYQHDIVDDLGNRESLITWFFGDETVESLIECDIRPGDELILSMEYEAWESWTDYGWEFDCSVVEVDREIVKRVVNDSEWLNMQTERKEMIIAERENYEQNMEN